MNKKLLSLFLALCILCSMVSALTLTASAGDDGVCGDGVTWHLSGSKLSIQGTGMMYDYSEENPAPWSWAAGQIQTVTITDGYVYYIGENAFSGFSALTTVNLSNISASIGAGAFKNCTALTEITIPSKYLAIGNGAFAGCTELTSFTWDRFPDIDLSKQLGSYAFNGCSKLENVSLPQDLETAGGFTFAGCTALEYIHIPGKIENLPRNMFFSCTSLKTVSVGNGIKTISPNAFAYCESLTSVDLPDTLESIQAKAFSNCTALTELAIPAKVNTVSADAFEKCSSLKNLHFLGDMSIANAELTNVPEDLVICYTEEAEGWENCVNTTHKVDYIYLHGEEEEGVHVAKCDFCFYAFTEEHNFVYGYCQECNAENPVKPTETSIKIGHTVSFDSDLKVNYRVKYTDLTSALPNYVTEGAYLVVEKDLYLASGSTSVTTVILHPDLVTDETRMVFSLGGIQSVEMGSELRAVLHVFDADGNEYCTPVDVYSVLTYAAANIPTTTNAAFRTLLVDLLNYGASAQIYFGRNTDNLVNAGIDAYQQYATTALSEELNDGRTYIDNDREITAVTAMGFSVVFADKTEMIAKLTIAEGYTKEDITCVKVLNASGEVVETITEFTEASDGRLQVTYYGVKSIQMREMFQFVAYVGDKVASQNVAYSVEAYVNSNIDSANTKLADMVLKCIYYGDSAYAYFTK